MFVEPFAQFANELDAGAPDRNVDLFGQTEDRLHHLCHTLLLVAVKMKTITINLIPNRV